MCFVLCEVTGWRGRSEQRWNETKAGATLPSKCQINFTPTFHCVLLRQKIILKLPVYPNGKHQETKWLSKQTSSNKVNMKSSELLQWSPCIPCFNTCRWTDLESCWTFSKLKGSFSSSDGRFLQVYSRELSNKKYYSTVCNLNLTLNRNLIRALTAEEAKR